LRKIGFSTNRRLLDVQRLSHDCAISEAAFDQVNRPVEVNGQRAAALRFADPTVQAVLMGLVLFRLLPEGFRNADLREQLAAPLGQDPSSMTQGRMTYHLRRLRLPGLIERMAGTHRYRVPEVGLRVAVFFTRTYARIVRPGLSQIMPKAPAGVSAFRRQFDQLEAAMDHWVERAKLAA
jgi:hypothetical protein